MLFAAYKEPYGKVDGGLYNTHEQYFRDTFSPDCEIIDCMELKVKGKTYKERKAYLKELAKRSQNIISELSLLDEEFCTLSDFFELNGRRYGLLQEFRYNCIC